MSHPDVGNAALSFVTTNFAAIVKYGLAFLAGFAVGAWLL